MSTIRVTVSVGGEDLSSASLTDERLTAEGIFEKYNVSLITTANRVLQQEPGYFYGQETR